MLVRLMNGSLMTAEQSNRAKSRQDTKETTGGGGGGSSRLEIQEEVMSSDLTKLTYVKTLPPLLLIAEAHS